jgi:hypothetical protein
MFDDESAETPRRTVRPSSAPIRPLRPRSAASLRSPRRRGPAGTS